jgi:hypothetical protein
MKNWVLFLLALLSLGANAANITMQCGNFRMEAIPNSLFKINGEYVTSQKIQMLGKEQTGMKVEMSLMPASDGYMYGFEYIHNPGSNERWLNVELVQPNMDAPRIIGTFDCRKIED